MSDQMPAKDVIATQQIASLRIHVERVIKGQELQTFLHHDDLQVSCLGS